MSSVKKACVTCENGKHYRDEDNSLRYKCLKDDRNHSWNNKCENWKELQEKT